MPAFIVVFLSWVEYELNWWHKYDLNILININSSENYIFSLSLANRSNRFLSLHFSYYQ